MSLVFNLLESVSDGVCEIGVTREGRRPRNADGVSGGGDNLALRWRVRRQPGEHELIVRHSIC